jgi:hypothetical protein
MLVMPVLTESIKTKQAFVHLSVQNQRAGKNQRIYTMPDLVADAATPGNVALQKALVATPA